MSGRQSVLLKKASCLLAFALGLPLVSCDPSAGERIAVALDANSSRPTVFIHLCEGTLVSRVQLVEPVGVVVDDGDDPVLWGIEADNGPGVAIDAVTLGEVPDGFDVVAPLEASPPTHRTFAFVVETSTNGNSIVHLSNNFEISALSREVLLHKGELVEDDEFRESAQEWCSDN